MVKTDFVKAAAEFVKKNPLNNLFQGMLVEK